MSSLALDFADLELRADAIRARTLRPRQQRGARQRAYAARNASVAAVLPAVVQTPDVDALDFSNAAMHPPAPDTYSQPRDAWSEVSRVVREGSLGFAAACAALLPVAETPCSACGNEPAGVDGYGPACAADIEANARHTSPDDVFAFAEWLHSTIVPATLALPRTGLDAYALPPGYRCRALVDQARAMAAMMGQSWRADAEREVCARTAMDCARAAVVEARQLGIACEFAG